MELLLLLLLLLTRLMYGFDRHFVFFHFERRRHVVMSRVQSGLGQDGDFFGYRWRAMTCAVLSELVVVTVSFLSKLFVHISTGSTPL